MKVIMDRCIALPFAFVLSGCVSLSNASATDGSGSNPSLCDIAENLNAYNGLDVELQARYVSDGRHEEVLEDLTCEQGRRIIDIGRRGDSLSVAEFYTERKRICSARGSSYLCNTTAKVNVLGTINVMNGEYVLDVKEFREYKFLDGRE